MPPKDNLEQKAKQRSFKLIIGEPNTSTSSFVKETTIKLDPSAGERGKGKEGIIMGAKKNNTVGSGQGITAGMGGRRK